MGKGNVIINKNMKEFIEFTTFYILHYYYRKCNLVVSVIKQ